MFILTSNTGNQPELFVTLKGIVPSYDKTSPATGSKQQAHFGRIALESCKKSRIEEQLNR